MGDPEKSVDPSAKTWLAETRVLLKAAREKPRGVADDSALDRSRGPADKPPSAQGRQQDLASADPAAVLRQKKKAELQRQMDAVGNPDEATAEDLKPLDQARQAGQDALAAVPLTDGALTTAANELLRLQAAAKSAAEAVLKRLRASVTDEAKPLADPSLAAPPDAEGTEWKPVSDAVALATQTQQTLMSRELLRSEDIAPLKTQVAAALDARGPALQAIQQRLRLAADALLAKVEAPALQRVESSSDSEWKPVADLVAEVRKALVKTSLAGDDLRAAESLLQGLAATLREVRTVVRERLAKEADEVRIKVNLASGEIGKQRKSKLGSAEKSELKVVDDYIKRLDDLVKPKPMSGSQIALAHQAADSQPVVLANVLAMVKARELGQARREVHADVRKGVDTGFAALPAVVVYDKLRADVAEDPSTDRSAGLATAAQDAVKALQAAELDALKAALKVLTKEAAEDINATLLECAKAVHASSKDPARITFVSNLKVDPELAALNTRQKDLSDKLAAASGYDAAVAAVPGLVASAKRRGKQLLAEHRLSTALGTTPSKTGQTVDARMTLLRDIRSDLTALERRVLAVQSAGLPLPSTDRVLAEIEKLSDAIDSAQAVTLEDDCAAWRKKLISLGASHDSDITALRLARATTLAGADYLKDKSKLYRSGGAAPSRGDVEAAIGASADPGHTLGAWGYTWDALLAEIRNSLKDGRLTQEQLDKLSGGGGQRYVNLNNHHISVTFRSEGSLYCVYELHVSLETAPENGRPRYWFSVTDGVIAAKPSTQAKPNPSGVNIPPGYAATAVGLINANKTKYNCK